MAEEARFVWCTLVMYGDVVVLLLFEVIVIDLITVNSDSLS